MDETIKLKTPGGKDVVGRLIYINSSSEHWSEYLLDDGSTIRAKFIATKVFRVDGEYDIDGNPVYIVRSTNVVTVSSPDNLKKGSADGNKSA